MAATTMQRRNCATLSLHGKSVALGIAFVVLTTLVPPPSERLPAGDNGNALVPIDSLAQTYSLDRASRVFGRPKIVLARADYVDQIGQLSNLMSKFVDSMLEKVSFLAEIIIESALLEQCDAPIECTTSQSTPTTTLASSSTASTAETINNADSDAVAIASETATMDEREVVRRLIANKTFDRLEYDNAELFRSQLVGDYEEPQPTAGEQASKRSCKLFNLIDLSRNDLPVSEMEECCEAYGDCYGTCGSKKADCDTKFFDCLKDLCTQKFDYTNKTLVRKVRSAQLSSTQSAADEPFEPLADDLISGDSDDIYADDNGQDEDAWPPTKFDGLRPSKRSAPAAERTGSERRDVQSLRDRYKACRLASKILILGNMAFGCQSYKRAQRRACSC